MVSRPDVGPDPGGKVMTLATKPVTRETAAIYRHRPLVVTIKPRHLELREKGRRDTLAVDYATIYEMAMKLRWRRE
jgi:hypothetical protein